MASLKRKRSFMRPRIAINGFGRIGRLVLRVALEKGIDVVAINDLLSPEHLAYLFKYDTVHRTYPGAVSFTENTLEINGKSFQVFAEKEPEKLPWGSLGVDYVVEATGRFNKWAEAEKHCQAGAKRVVITAPAKEVPTFVMGVNHGNYNPKTDQIVCNASCTTNCLAPLCKVLLDHFGIEEGLMTTVHALTATQPTVDAPSRKDFRGGRAANYNIIPSSTGAAKAVGLCLPELQGKLTGMAFRVPVLDVSAVDLTVKLKTDTTYEALAEAMQKASQSELQGILTTTTDPVVSSDFIGSPYSCIFDEKAGIALNRRFYKLIAWYDNEMGYSHRVLDLVEYMAKQE